MRATGPSIAIIQHLKSLGIKIRTPKKVPSPDAQRKTPSVGLFGVSLHSLPLCKKEGEIPQFVVDICQFLSHHLDTEGLFRKSGSVTRIKTLKAQLDAGETTFAGTHPSDVAALLKQFFRDLPQPLIPPELQDPLCQIQESLGERDRAVATTLVTCLLPALPGATLRYVCTFLQEVAFRCLENKMDSGNLAVVLAPNLFASSGLGEKMTVGTERQLQLQTAAMQTLIDHAQSIGQLPLFILEKLPLTTDGAEDESVTTSGGGGRRKRRLSVGGIVNDALNKLKPSRTAANLNPERTADETDQLQRSKTKRKASEETGSGETVLAKKRKSLPEVVDGGQVFEDQCYQAVVLSPCGDSPIGEDIVGDLSSAFLEMNTASPDTLVTPKPCPHGQQRSRNQRKENKRMSRMQSGVCVSPVQLERKEKVRSSLRLFHRSSRAAKPSISDGKILEQSSWNLVKRMVAEALEGPIFNSRDFRVASSQKSADSVAPSSASGAPSPSCPSSVSPLRSSPWKLKLRGRAEVEDSASGKKCRTLRRSLSMPEGVGESGSGDGEPLSGVTGDPTPASSEEGGMNEIGLVEAIKTVVEGTQVETCSLLTEEMLVVETNMTPSLKSQVSISKLSHCTPPLRRSDAHTTPLRNICKLVLSSPSVRHSESTDPDMEDWGKLDTHTLQRKGARRFGRSLSHESGLGTAEEKDNQELDNPLLSGSPTSTLFNRSHTVYVSRKNITLSNGFQQSTAPVTPNWGPSPLHNMVDD